MLKENPMNTTAFAILMCSIAIIRIAGFQSCALFETKLILTTHVVDFECRCFSALCAKNLRLLQNSSWGTICVRSVLEMEFPKQHFPLRDDQLWATNGLLSSHRLCESCLGLVCHNLTGPVQPRSRRTSGSVGFETCRAFPTRFNHSHSLCAVSSFQHSDSTWRDKILLYTICRCRIISLGKQWFLFE